MRKEALVYAYCLLVLHACVSNCTSACTEYYLSQKKLSSEEDAEVATHQESKVRLKELFYSHYLLATKVYVYNWCFLLPNHAGPLSACQRRVGSSQRSEHSCSEE